MQMSRIELCVTVALPMAAGICYGKGLVLSAAIVAGVVALYLLAAGLQPSAKWLLFLMTSALAVGAAKAKCIIYFCVNTLRVRLRTHACCTILVQHSAVWQNGSAPL